MMMMMMMMYKIQVGRFILFVFCFPLKTLVKV